MDEGSGQSPGRELEIPARRPRPLAKELPILRALVCLVAGAAIGTASIGLGRAHDRVGPFTLTIATAPGVEGRTTVDLEALKQALGEATGLLSRLGLGDVVNLPEAGIVSAKTHSTPLLLRLTITEVDPDRVGEILPRQASSLVELLSPLKTRLTATLAQLAARTIAIGAAGGFLLALLLRGRILGALAGLAGGAAAPAAIFALTGATYELNAFRQPLAAAGALLGLR
jgi:hypothetical protein